MEEKTPVKSGRIRVTNLRHAPKYIYDVNGKIVAIPPMGSATLFVVERQERDLNRVKYLRVEPVSDDQVDDVTTKEDVVTEEEQHDDNEEQTVLTPQELLDRVEEMEYPELLRQSKLTLGDKFPTGRAGGQPRKSELVRVLRSMVD